MHTSSLFYGVGLLTDVFIYMRFNFRACLEHMLLEHKFYTKVLHL
jgi:hypothetical protein